jgi:hypothetical protein
VITDADIVLLADRCSELPKTDSVYLATDFVSCLLDTVIDFQQHTTTVRRAIDHFNAQRWDEVRTLGDLEAVLAQFPDDQDGNTALAQHLWGYKLWTRAHMLRGLTELFAAQGVSDLESLRRWAEMSTYKEDFEGRVPGLGPTVYNWLVMRLGVETVKPDVHILRFVESTLGRRTSADDAVTVVSAAAKRLGLRAYELDWRIWEFQRNA